MVKYKIENPPKMVKIKLHFSPEQLQEFKDVGLINEFGQWNYSDEELNKFMEAGLKEFEKLN